MVRSNTSIVALDADSSSAALLGARGAVRALDGVPVPAFGNGLLNSKHREEVM